MPSGTRKYLPRQRRAISLIETLAAMFVLSLAGVAILNLFATSHETRGEANIRLAATMRSEEALSRFLGASETTRADLLRDGESLPSFEADLPKGTTTTFFTQEETLALGSAQTRVRVLRIRATVADQNGFTLAALERLEPLSTGGAP
ncbi:MAG: hypothetical protein EXS10_08715 [Phycisphaerales bacterium]|nr:hypothetical protein [Phycisphaerales bacterium]